MKSAAGMMLVALMGTAALVEASKEHPISGVITLMEDLQVQAKEEGEADASTYQKFSYWCTNAKKDVSASIASHKENIDTLNSQIKGAKSDILALEFNIRKLGKDVARRSASNERALKNREEDEADYSEDQSDYASTLEAFSTAINAMELTQQVANGASLAQKTLVAKRAVKKAMIYAETQATKKQMQVFHSFLQAAPGKQEVETHGSVVIDLLKSLKADFEKRKIESVKEETEDKNAYELAKQAQDYAIKETEEAKGEKEGILGSTDSDRADYLASLTEEENSLAADTAQLSAVTSDCETKANEWDIRSKTRNGEIEAMSMAVKILSKVTNVRNPDEHEVPKKVYMQVSFLQVDDPKVKAMNLLKQVATKTHSKALQKLATEIGTFDGPFDKIKAMIQKMIFRLMAEQKDEDDHKNWCDMELEKSTTSKDDKDDKMALLNANIATANAEVAEFTEKISLDEEEAATITKYIADEKALRQENSAENAATVTDAQAAQKAVADATAVLKAFYKESGMIAKEPYEFVQTGQEPEVSLPENPSTWDASYTGVTDPNAEGTGVLAILGKCAEDFAQMEADAAAQEETDEKAFQQDLTAQEMDKAEKSKDADMKGARKTALMQKLEGMNSKKAHLTSELEAVNTYLKDLEPACVSGDSSYADRKAARADEIAALRKAQNILEEAFTPSFLQKRK